MDSNTNQSSVQDTVLQLENVTIDFTGEKILDGVDLKVMKGETIVIIGPSGGGKTVLLKTLAGLFPPKSGQAFCMGQPWKARSQDSRHDLARKIGMQFQRSALFDELTAYGNIEFVLKEHTDLSPEERDRRIIECLKSVGLEKYKDYREHQLSGGMKQRVGIARSVALSPDILFMDDPTAGLDPINADDMAELILSLKNRISATLVVVTHDILRAYQFAGENGRILLVANGKIIETGNAEQTEACSDPLVQQFIHGWLKGPLTTD
ncbi:MAG: ATP-binding cassette domain-containing protein [Deltaproteobacteria bacterium]|nr:ATP-binding cassette domain-containing protein [Deltaproteobacteria bacterium]